MAEFLLLKELHRPPPLRPGQTSTQARYLTAEHPCRASGFVLWVEAYIMPNRHIANLNGKPVSRLTAAAVYKSAAAL